MVEGLEAIAGQLPFSVLGIDSDNDGAFINDTPVQYCVKRAIEFTRSRAYRKNDQAWIEQKNGSAVRRFTGSPVTTATRARSPGRRWFTCTRRSG